LGGVSEGGGFAMTSIQGVGIRKGWIGWTRVRRSCVYMPVGDLDETIKNVQGGDQTRLDRHIRSVWH
jgi:hypothetical protein